MFRLELDVEDLSAARFCISPLHETVASMWPVYGRHPGNQPWARRVRALPAIDHELLESIVSPRGWIPDFVAPPPVVAQPSITGQLAQVRAIRPEKVIADVLAAYGPTPLSACLRELTDDPAGLRNRIAAALERYWHLAIAPHWHRLRALLEADLMHRGLQLAQRGPGAAFAGLDPRIRWRDGGLTVDIIRQWRRNIPVAGRGVQLVPSLFAPFPHLPVDADDPPVLGYPARGTAALWPVTPAPSPSVGSALLGRPRARLLALLDQPASTTQLACRLDVTPSAVSQRLRVLHAAGLVTRARAGRTVLYQRTPAGAQLVTGPAEPGR